MGDSVKSIVVSHLAIPLYFERVGSSGERGELHVAPGGHATCSARSASLLIVLLRHNRAWALVPDSVSEPLRASSGPLPKSARGCSSRRRPLAAVQTSACRAAYPLDFPPCPPASDNVQCRRLGRREEARGHPPCRPGRTQYVLGHQRTHSIDSAHSTEILTLS